MNTELINNLYKLAEETCKSKKNEYGFGIWSHHIKPMIQIAQKLAKQFGADVEVVTIATLLHDLAGIKNSKDKKEHHIIGAKQAEVILKQYDFSIDKIKSVQQCIKNHRSSVNNSKNTIEEICVADADAIVHMLEITSLFYVAYTKLGMEIDDGKNWVRDKIKRDWDKMSSQSRLLYEQKYNAIIEILK
jgi:putative nucleotidyltransferase with HDIG domain